MHLAIIIILFAFIVVFPTLAAASCACLFHVKQKYQPIVDQCIDTDDGIECIPIGTLEWKFYPSTTPGWNRLHRVIYAPTPPCEICPYQTGRKLISSVSHLSIQEYRCRPSREAFDPFDRYYTIYCPYREEFHLPGPLLLPDDKLKQWQDRS
jgi:hypothetical protein